MLVILQSEFSSSFIKILHHRYSRSSVIMQASEWTEESICNSAFNACQKAGILILEGSKSISLTDDVVSKIGRY